jgi:hypothetical protein
VVGRDRDVILIGVGEILFLRLGGRCEMVLMGEDLVKGR